MNCHDIIDAHMHLPWQPATPIEKSDVLISTLRKERVRGGIIIADSERESSICSTEDCVNLLDGNPMFKIVGGISPLIDYEQRLQLSEHLLREEKLAGLKLYCGHEPIYIDDPSLDPIFRLAERYGVPVLFHSGWDNAQFSAPDRIALTAERFANVTLVCCHCCYPNLAGCFELLSKYANVMFDISSIADEGRSELRPVLESAIHAIPERFMYGSDYASCDMRTHIEFAENLRLNETERRLLMCKNAERIYGF